MGASIKTRPELVRPAGSHSLTLSYGREFGPFDREELFPVLELEAPRVGKVRADFEANRYVHSSGWSEWRIFLRDVRRPDPERPAIGGAEVSGVGPATRDAIRDACLPLIEEWLEGSEYRASREIAAARALVQKIDAPRDWAIEQARTLLEQLERAGELEPRKVGKIEAACEQLERARALLEEVTGS
jgi:hypothetical protein